MYQKDKKNEIGKKIGGVLIRVVLDFTIFWWIFLWKDGVVWERISSIADGQSFGDWIAGIWAVIPALLSWLWGWICVIAENLWHLLVFLAPYSREAALDPQFLYCLHWCSGAAALWAILISYTIADDSSLGILPSILIGLAIGVAVWYAGFGVCFLLVKIPVWFHVLAALGAAGACSLVALLLFGFAIEKLDL